MKHGEPGGILVRNRRSARQRRLGADITHAVKEQLKLSTERRPEGRAVIRVEGSVDLASFKQFEAAFRWFDEQRLAYLVVDMTLLTYMASSGFGLLIKAKSDCAGKKGDVVLVAPPPPVLDVLKMLGLASLFRIAASVDEALAPPDAR